jgi:hypothetical protein
MAYKNHPRCNGIDNIYQNRQARDWQRGFLAILISLLIVFRHHSKVILQIAIAPYVICLIFQ